MRERTMTRAGGRERGRNEKKTKSCREKGHERLARPCVPADVSPSGGWLRLFFATTVLLPRPLSLSLSHSLSWNRIRIVVNRSTESSANRIMKSSGLSTNSDTTSDRHHGSWTRVCSADVEQLLRATELLHKTFVNYDLDALIES